MPNQILRDNTSRTTTTTTAGRRYRQPAPCLFPIGPLLRITGMTRTPLQRHVHASGYTVRHAARHGLTASQAYTWADRLGFHPAEVWGNAWWTLTAKDGRP